MACVCVCICENRRVLLSLLYIFLSPTAVTVEMWRTIVHAWSTWASRLAPGMASSGTARGKGRERKRERKRERDKTQATMVNSSEVMESLLVQQQ